MRKGKNQTGGETIIVADKRRSKLAKTVALIGVGAAGATLWMQGCDPLVSTRREVTAPKAKETRILPVAVDCRAYGQSEIVDTASLTFQTAADHIPVVNFFTGTLERSMRNKSIFTGKKKGGGEVDTLFCLKPDGQSIQTGIDKKTGVQRTVFNIPKSSVVEFSAINETSSNVIERDGDLAMLARFEWTVAGGILQQGRDTVEQGRAALDAVARAEAINVAQRNCGVASWYVAKLAIEDGIRLNAKKQHDNQASLVQNLAPFDPTSISVNWIGPGETPDFTGAYEIPSGTVINDGKNVPCHVSADAYPPSSYIDALGNQVPTSLNALQFPAPKAA